MWRDIAAIVFICTTANHLGLISAIESAIKRKLWIVDCPKCSAFWATLVYETTTVPCVSPQGLIAVIPHLLAISLLAAYTAIWLELFEGIIDKLCDYVYNKIYPTTDTDDADT